jgi:two-component system CheB/CheR fusion protein
MGDAVVVVDKAAQPVMTNAAFERMLATAGGHFLPQDENGRVLPPDAQPLRRAARGETFSMKFILGMHDGTSRWYEANGAPVRTTDVGQQAVVVIRDITERSLQQLQEEFLARASHELRTPLTPLRAYLQLLQQHLGDKPENAQARYYAERALGQLTQMTRLVGDLMDMSRMQIGKYALALEPVRLDELVSRGVEAGQLQTTQQTIALANAGEPLVVSADDGRLEQVVLNLLTNAISYSGNAKRIEVRLRRVGNEAELQVQDFGAGIPASDLLHVFSRYYQADGGRQGLGLGLYIASEIVQAHGGTLTVASTPGKGSIFTVRLPLATGGAQGGTGASGTLGSLGAGGKPRKR